MKKRLLMVWLLLIFSLVIFSFTKPEMVEVEGGIFYMGNTRDDSEGWDSEEKPIHQVQLTYNFAIGKYEITFEQYNQYCEDTNSRKPIDDITGHEKKPVSLVSWFDAIHYCNWLSEKTGLRPAYDEKGNLLNGNGEITTDITEIEGYRLPTEAEWEYSARGGQESPYDYKYSGSNDLEEVGWYYKNSRSTKEEAIEKITEIIGHHHFHPQNIGQKNPNVLGIFDMSGNAWEWCQDYWYYYNDENEVNPVNTQVYLFKIYRGGGWDHYGKHCRISSRGGFNPKGAKKSLGFRIAKTVQLVLKSEKGREIDSENDENHSQTLSELVMGNYDLVKEFFSEAESFLKTDEKETKDQTKYSEGARKYLPAGGSFVALTSNKFFIGETQKLVNITYPLLIGKYEITNHSYLYFLNDVGVLSNGQHEKKQALFITSSDFAYSNENELYILKKRDAWLHPVTGVTWWGAIQYCNWLSEKYDYQKAYDSEGHLLDINGKRTQNPGLVQGFRLPTEAEWEYAAKGGRDNQNYSKDYSYSGSNNLNIVGWYQDNSKEQKHEIGEKEPNNASIYDMSGNVEEWCYDCYSSEFYQDSKTNDPVNLDKNMAKVIRGGSFRSPDFLTQITIRKNQQPEKARKDIGFRIVRTKNVSLSNQNTFVPQAISPKNNSLFSHYPRELHFKWTDSCTEYKYLLLIQYCWEFDASNQFGIWENGNYGVLTAKYLEKSHYSGNFVGTQPGRWRVKAVDDEKEAETFLNNYEKWEENGTLQDHLDDTWSDWSYFSFNFTCIQNP